MDDFNLKKANIIECLDRLEMKNAELADAADKVFDGAETVLELKKEDAAAPKYTNAILFPMTYDRNSVASGAILLDREL
jgi:uncharacterized protein (UPF0335 family)